MELWKKVVASSNTTDSGSHDSLKGKSSDIVGKSSDPVGKSPEPVGKLPEPVSDDDEDLVDPHDTLREKCAAKASCVALKEVLETCNTRVEGKEKTSETCVEELIDYMHCVDECAAKTLFNYLK